MSERYLSPNWHRFATLRPQLKGGVTIAAHRYLGRIWYVLRDPATAQHHRFTPAACRLIMAMDGETTIDEIWKQAVENDGELAPSQTDLQRLLVHLHNADLIASDISPAVNALDERRLRHVRQRQERLYKNPLSIVLPLFNPDPAFVRFARWRAILPDWLWTGLYLALVLPALLIGATLSHELFANLSDAVLSANNLVILALVTPVVKLWHEIGHGVVSRRYGGPVRETGLMFVAFYPMPYVDASASSAFPSKWRRVHVAAGGMLFEFALAALALLVWASVEDGLVKAIAFNVIIVAGVSTLLINGNPLLRFDGYYILCDLIEMPNLGQRSNRYWGYLVEKHLFGARHAKSEVLRWRERIVFVVYAPLAWIYRTAVSLGIAIFVAQHYFIVGVVIAIWSIWLGTVWPLLKLLKILLAGERLAEVRRRAVLTCGAAAGAITLLSLVPIPAHTMADGVVWLPETAFVRARAPGFVRGLTQASGTRIAAGDTLARLDNQAILGELQVQRFKVAEAATKATVDAFGDQAKLQLLVQELADTRAAEARLAERAARLSIASEASGLFVAPDAPDLPGRFIAEGGLIGHVLPSEATQIRMVVSQENIDLVRAGVSHVEVRLAGALQQAITARLVREVPAASNELPSAALGNTGGGPFAVDPKDDKGITTLSRVFQFDLDLATPVPPAFGARAFVKLTHEPQSLARQLGRRIRQLFLSQFAV